MELKFEYTEGNHFKWGYGDEWYNEPNKDKTYKIQLGYTKRPVGTFREECVNSARLIGEKATKPILVGLSGGGDSQMVCLSMLEAKVPFKVVIVKLFDEFWSHVNSEDNETAYAFCEKYNIEYFEHMVNLDYFYNDQALDYAEKYGFTQLHTIVQCGVMDQFCPDYCYIMAGGDIVFTPYANVVTPDITLPKITNTVNPDAITIPVWWQTPQPIMQHMLEMGYEGTSKFFLYTPELMAAYLQDKVVSDFLENKHVIFQTFTRWFPRPKDIWWRCFHMMYKPILVKHHFPEIIANRKLTGFEEIEKINSKNGPRTLFETYQKKINIASKGVNFGQVIVPTVEELIEYITTPHTHSLEATKLLYNVYNP